MAGTDELDAAAAAMAIEPELGDAAAAAPVDISTTSAPELNADHEGEQRIKPTRIRTLRNRPGATNLHLSIPIIR